MTFAKLTARETDILRVMTSETFTAKGAAKLLGISHRTVELHMSRIIRKLGARNQLHAVLTWDREHRAAVLHPAVQPFAHRLGQGSASIASCGCWSSDVSGVHHEHKCPAHVAGVAPVAAPRLLSRDSLAHVRAYLKDWGCLADPYVEQLLAWADAHTDGVQAPEQVKDCHTCAHNDKAGNQHPCKSCLVCFDAEHGGHTVNWEPRIAGVPQRVVGAQEGGNDDGD